MEHTINELQMLQGLPLKDKIVMAKERIKAWVDHWGLENVAISFSGGKDSTVLLDIARGMYPDIEAVHVNTGLEFPEIECFVKTFNNVTILKPKMNFIDVIRKYGYPMISKEVSETVQGARKYLTNIANGTQSLTDRQTDRQTEYSYRYRKLTGTGIYKKRSKTSVEGGYSHIPI